jgi:predicted CoA-substrate-specific enzyme activase
MTPGQGMKNNLLEREALIVAGIDIGAATTKAVILGGNNKVLSSSIAPTGHSVAQAGELVLSEALEEAALSFDDLQYIVSIGYGRRSISFSNKAVSEIICHATGVNSIMPQARTIIDIGGQDSKVIGLEESGNVVNFGMNDKCAAGTGRFLEVMASVLHVEIAEMGPESLNSKEPCQISSTCTVFAESEMVSLRSEGRSRVDLLAGIHKAVAHRVVIMGKQVGFRKDVVFTGGVAKNVGVKKALEAEIGLELLVPEEPQIMGALGAAILAEAEVGKEVKKQEGR